MPLLQLAHRLADHRDRPALLAEGVAITYGELARRADAVGAAMGEGRRLVMVEATNDVGAVVAHLGALRAGHVVLLVPGDRPATTQRLLSTFDPDVVVSARTDWRPHLRRPRAAHDLHPDLALLLCTSGSTGCPRLVRLSHANLQSNADAIAGYLGLSVDDRAITSLPIHYCYGLSVLHSHLAVGAAVVVTDRSVVDQCFWHAVERHGVTNLSGVPYTFDLLDRVGFDAMEVPTLRFLTQAGGRLAPDRVRNLAALGKRRGWDLFVMYGQTEATARMAYLPPALAEEHPGSIGLPIPGGAFEIESVEGFEDPDVGELVYRGPNVMLGYADGPADLANGPTIGSLRTGDLARRGATGLYEVVGRRSRFTKVLGLRIDLQHVEDLLAEQSVDALCAGDDERVVVAVTEAAHVAVAQEVLRARCGLPPSRASVAVLTPLPRLPNGKPDYDAVGRAGARTPVAAPALPSEPSGDDVHPAVHRRILEVLQVDQVTGDDTFVSLGGDSLSYVEMSIALEATLGGLPERWHTTPLRNLQPAADRPDRRRLRRTETTVVLRAVAIVLVVGTHIKLFEVLGGAHLLLGIAGFNFARFQVRTLDRVRSLARIAVPSMLWLAVATTLNDRIHLAHVLLLNGWIGGEDSHGGYWYIEAVVQILVPLIALLAIPAVGRAVRRQPFWSPMAFLGAGLLVRFHLLDLPTVEPHDIRPHDIVWIFAIGWAAAAAVRLPHKALLSAIVLASVPGYFGEPVREVLVVTGLLLVLWVPHVRVPWPLNRVVGSVAAASLYIYLTHWQVFRPTVDRFGPLAGLGASIAAGVLAWTLSRRAAAAGGRLVQWARRRERPVVPWVARGRATPQGALAGMAVPVVAAGRPAGASEA